MFYLFWRQFRALTWKNLIVISNHWLLNILRCLVLPVAFALFFGYVFKIFSRPDNLGFGAPIPIPSLSDTWTADTIYYVDATTTTPSRVPDLVSKIVVFSGLSPSQQSRLKPLPSRDAIRRACPSNFKLISECFAVLVFDYVPLDSLDKVPMNYTIRIDGGRRRVDVDKHTSDYERVALPLQWAVDQAGMAMLGVGGISTPREWPYTRYNNEAAKLKGRLSYVDTIESFLVFVFFFVFLGVAYQLSGAFVEESTSGLASLMHVMGCGCAARIISWYLSISFAYLPAWIATAVIWQYRVFSQTSVGLLIAIHVIAGFSLASFSLVICMPFRKSPQLAAIGTTFLSILFSIIALFIPMHPATTALYTLVFPPGFFVFAIKAVSRFEQNLQGARVAFVHGGLEGQILGSVIVAAVADVFLWLLIAGVAERWSLGSGVGGNAVHRGWTSSLRRLFGLSYPAPATAPQPEPESKSEPGSDSGSESTGTGRTDISCVTSRPNWFPPAITLNRLTKKYPPAKWRAPPITAVEDLSLAIPSRGIFVLLGANGSGKSTTLGMVAGLEKPTSGSVVFGSDEEGLEDGRGAGRAEEKPGMGKRSLGLVPQRDVLFPELTCYQTVRLWRDIKLPLVRPCPSVPLETSPESLEQLLRDCDLHGKIHSPAATLSGGQKRKLQLAAGLVGGSRIVLVDEATSGVDPLSRRAIWKALVKAREGRCVVFTTHFLDEADLLADEIAILAAPGKLLAQGSPVSLKSKLGDGYSIHVTRNSSALFSSPDPILSAIRAHAPLAYPDDTDPDTYILRSKSTRVVGQILDDLEERKDELGVDSYDVQSTTMETIFLKLMGDGGRSGSSTPKEDDLIAVRDSGFLSVDETLFSRTSSVELDQKHEPLALSDGHRTSPFRQALTGFHKRALILRRSWLSYALMVVIAITGACVPIVFARGRASTCSFAKDLEISSPLYLPTARSLALALYGKNVTDKYKPVVSPPDLLASLNATRLPQIKVPDAEAFSQTIVQTYRNLSLGGLEVHNGEATIAWEASPGSRSGPALLNLASNVLANAALGESSTGPRIIAYFQDLPGTRIIGMAMALKWEGFFGAAMGLWPAFFVLYVSVERCSSVQAMQLSNGMTPAGLWLGHLLFDLPWITFISTVICVVFGVATNQFYALGGFWVVLELYGVAGALFAYVVSTFVSSPLAGFAVAGGYNGMMSMLYGTAYIVTLTYTQSSESRQALEIVHYTVSLLSPVASVVRAAFVSINVFSLLCDGFGNYDPSPPPALNKFGGPIIYLVGWIIFLFSLLMWIEYGKPRPKWLRFRRDIPPVETDTEKTAAQNGAFGAEVKAEAERVRQSKDALRLLGVGKTFPGPFTAVDDATFGVDNEMFAMLGPNGAGKTTTFNIIRGNIRPTRGDVFISGTSIVNEPAAARLSLGVTPQFSAADSQLTVREHVMIYGSLKGLHGKDLKRNVDLLLEATALTQYQDRLANKLSGGNARKLSLALALIGNPRVLLIDEYSTGVDAATKRAMWKTLRRVSSGKAVVITTHSMEEASALASRVGILSKRMLAIGTPDALVSRFSTYEVHFAARTPLESSRASALMSRFPGSRQAEDVATRYEVPIGQNSLAGLFRTLSDQRCEEEDTVTVDPELEYTIERLGLESVFLKVIQEGEVGAEADAKTKRWWKAW